MQVVHSAFFEAEMLVKGLGLGINGMHQDGSRANRFRGLQAPLECVLQ